LLDEHGQLMADSHSEGPPEGPEQPAPHILPRSSPEASTWAPRFQDVSERPEVERALSGHYGATTRLWKDQGIFYLFSALPILKDGGVAGVVYVTRSTIPVQFAMYRLRTTLFTILGAALLVTSVLSLFLAATISRPLSRLTRLAGRIAEGD